MSSLGDELAFRYYLEHKYHDDFLKFDDPNTPQEVKNSIISKHAYEFDIYKQIPYDVLLKWQGNPPKEIMEAASQGNIRKLQLDPYNIKESDDVFSNYNNLAPAPEQIMETAVFVAAINQGYSQDASMALAQESMFRELLADKARKNALTADEREIWRKSREKTRDIIRKDWAENTPEKLLIHIFAKYNRGKISASELSDTTSELIGRIEAMGRHEELLNYLSSPRIQRRLSRFDDEVLDALSQTVLNNIKLTDEQSRAVQSHIAGRNISRAKREMLEHTPDNLSAQQRIQNIPSTLTRGERTI